MRTQQPENEKLRLQKLYECRILDTPPEQVFDDIVSLAAHICGTPYALITLVDSDREWFKAKKGITINESPRASGFCAQTILQPDIMVVPNALGNKRFATNALVTSEPNIRFYAGVPVKTPTGEALGTLCVLDKVPRELSAENIEALRALARQVGILLELMRKTLSLPDSLAKEKQCKHRLQTVLNRQKESEALLKNSERFTYFVLDAMLIHFCVLDEDGNVLVANKPPLNFEYEGILHTVEIGQNYLTLLDAGLADNRGGHEFTEGIRLVLNGSKSSFSLEYSNRTPSGYQWFIGKIFPITDRGGAIVIHENISEHKLLEARFRQAVESAPNAIVMVNESGTILMVNLQTETSLN